MQARSSAGAGTIRRLGALAVVIGAMSIAVASSPVVAAPGDPGTVSGRVVDGDGNPIAGICVNIAGGPGATSQGDGTYEISGVLPGTYSVGFTDCNLVPTFIPETLADAATVPVDDGVDPPEPGVILGDNTLVAGVAVSGTVTAADGTTPLEGIDVFVNPYGPGPGPSAGARTLADGTYRTGPLPDGTYRVQFDDLADEYATEFWDGSAVFNDADPLALSAAGGTERTGVDATLDLGASITGTVSGDAGPIGGICVNANTPLSSGGWNGVGFAQTVADGTYSIAGIPPGLDLRIEFFDCRTPTPSGPSYVGQWYSGAVDFDSSTSVLLGPGEARAGIDAQLTTGIRVAGTVTDEAGNPLPGINVSVNPDGPGQGGFGQTDSSGNYVTSAVLPGRFRVQFFDGAGTRASEYWDDQLTFGTATILELTPGDAPQRAGIDAQLGAGASISGTVTDAAGNPVSRACISVATETANGPDGVGGTQANDAGEYTVTGLPALPVRVRADDCDGQGPYLSRWWPNAATYDAATPITLTAGEQRVGVDFVLPPAASISGRVSDVNGDPVAGICVQAATADAFGALTQTDGDGEFQLVLGGGVYTVQFVDCSSQRYTGRTLGPISVEAGQAVSGYDAVLVAGATATISGTVRNGDGVAMTGACVVVYLANQYALFGQVLPDGTFSVAGIPSGTYAIAFLGCGTGGQPSAVVPDPVDPGRTYQGQWWQGVVLSLAGTGEGGPDPIAQGATLVAVPAGGSLSGFDVCFGCLQPPPPTTTTTTTTSTTTTTTAAAATPSSVTTTTTLAARSSSAGRLPTTGADSASTAWAAVSVTLAGAVILYAVRRPRRADH